VLAVIQPFLHDLASDELRESVANFAHGVTYEPREPWGVASLQKQGGTKEELRHG